jgi:hypothetical protein
MEGLLFGCVGWDSRKMAARMMGKGRRCIDELLRKKRRQKGVGRWRLVEEDKVGEQELCGEEEQNGRREEEKKV